MNIENRLDHIYLQPNEVFDSLIVSQDIINNSSNSSNSELIGGRYKKIKDLGRGAYGSVKLAEDLNGNKVALKKFYFRQNQDSRILVLNQIQLLNTLEHNCLPTLIENFIYNDSEYIAFDYYPLDLLYVIKNHPYDIDMNGKFYKSLIYLLIEGISFLHSNSIMHRDDF